MISRLLHSTVAVLALASGAITVGAAAPAARPPIEPVQRTALAAGREEFLAVIVNRSNPEDEVSLKELRSLAMIQRTHWPNGRKVTVALHEPGPTERQTVLQRIYRMNEAGFTRYFLQATFTGQIATGPRLLTTSEGIRRFVVNVPGAVGFIRLSDVDDSVKVLRIDGRIPGSPDYPLTLEP